MASPPRRPVILIIRDGWGENPHPEHDRFNAVKLARTPVADRLARTYPSTLIRTSGEDVGLPGSLRSDEAAATPDGSPGSAAVGEPVMGNSEVGHQNIGAGRIVDQELMRITRAIRDGRFARNETFLAAFDHARRNDARVHLLGLASDGKVHSDLDHLTALIDLAASRGVPADRLLIHAITDGRDTAPSSGLGHLAAIEATCARARSGRIASVIGRYYAMDRDFRWDRVQAAYDCLTRPVARRAASAVQALERYYAEPSDESRHGDEFVLPTQIEGAWAPVAAGDAVIFFNFRGDRPRELTMAFVLDDTAWRSVKEGGFARGGRIDRLFFVTMTAYEEGLPVKVAFEKPPKMPDILGDVLSRAGISQLRCAETEKYPHVTYFFNDYREQPFPSERRILVPSPKDVATYDQKPEMSAREVCEAVLGRIAAADGERAIVVNFANGDMVGHTGSLEATVRACEVVDECVGRIVDAALDRGGAVIITADHGNAEQMWDPVNNCPHTQHTNYRVPCIIAAKELVGRRLRDDGRLADLAPTMLALLGEPVPAAMTGRCLWEDAPAAAAR